MSEFQERDRGGILVQILRLKINVNKYQYINVSQYIPLPSSIQKNMHASMFKTMIIIVSSGLLF